MPPRPADKSASMLSCPNPTPSSQTVARDAKKQASVPATHRAPCANTLQPHAHPRYQKEQQQQYSQYSPGVSSDGHRRTVRFQQRAP